MNVENLNLVELETQEMNEIEGGYWPRIGWWMDIGFSTGSQQDVLYC